MPLDFPDSTNPTQETKVFRSAINAIAKTYRLRRDRMNDVVAAFIPPLSTESLMLWHDYPNLQVYVPQADCMLALKLAKDKLSCFSAGTAHIRTGDGTNFKK